MQPEQSIFDILLYCSVLLLISSLSFPYLRRKSELHISGAGCRPATKLGVSKMRLDGIAFFLAYGISIFFICFRVNDPDLGVYDANYYQEYFEAIPGDFFHYLNDVTTFEVGYSTVTWVVRRITGQYWVMSLIWNTLIFLCLARFLSHINLKQCGFFVVLLVEATLFDQLVTLRMAISIAIALNAFVEMSRNKWGVAFLILCIAASMQISALLLLPAYVIAYIYLHSAKQPLFWLVLLVFGGIAVASFSLALIYRIVSGTAKAVYFTESSLSLGVYFTMFVFSVLLFRRQNRVASCAPINAILIAIIPTCFLCVPLQLLASAFYRCLLFYIPIAIALIPSLLKSYRSAPLTVSYVATAVICYGYLLIRMVNFVTSQIPYFGIYQNWLLL